MQIRRIELDQTLPIRQQVLWSERPADAIVYPKDSEPDTFHLGAFYDGEQLVGIVTLYHDAATSWRLRGMGVMPDRQGSGIGAALVARAVAELEELGASDVWCNARVAVTGFYNGLGWSVEGEEFEVPGVGGHYVMRRMIG